MKRKLVLVGKNVISNTWEYDTHEKIAELYLDQSTNELIIKIKATHIKTGIGAGTTTNLVSSTEIGTLFEPKKQFARNILTQNKLSDRPFGISSWFVPNTTAENLKFNEVLDYTTNKNVLISRGIKLAKLSSKIKEYYNI